MPQDPLVSAIDDFLLALESEGRSVATLAIYGHGLRSLSAHLGPIAPCKISPIQLRAWLKAMADRGLTPRSQRNYLTTVKTFLGWLAEEGSYGVTHQQQQQCRSRVKPPPSVVEQIRPFTDAELERLEAGCNLKSGWMGTRLLAIISLLIDTGIRASELCGLGVGDVDLALGEIYVRAETSKVRRGRSIALGKYAKRDMGRWWASKRHLWSDAPDSPWFMGRNEEEITPRTLHRLLTRHGERCGVPDAHPHRFRHTAAVMALKGTPERPGMTPFAVMRMLGHTDFAMTQRYVNFLAGDVAEEKRQHSPLDGSKRRRSKERGTTRERVPGTRPDGWRGGSGGR